MTASHAPRQKPTPLLALVALAILHRYRPDWCATTLTNAASAENVRPDFLSRLATRALGPFEAILARLTRRGRPRAETRGRSPEEELGIARALLDVATSILKAVAPRQRGRCRDLIVGAWTRLRAEYPSLTQGVFAAAVGVPERTLRAWLKTPRVQRQPIPEPKSQVPGRATKLRRPRFRFDLVLPGVQFGADTTDLAAFDVDLKMVGVQDVSGRDRSLFDSVIIDTSESSEHVIAGMKKALENHAGAQALTDQGTPYMAKATRRALEALEVEHAPQKEGDPTGKSTVERGFKTIKGIAAPILNLTNELAKAFPGLRCEAFAKASTTLLMTALLRAYQAGGRAARRACVHLGQLSEEQLLSIAERSRETARATERSRRLFLAHVHEVYELSGSAQKFIRRFRGCPVQVLKDAERALRRALQRGNVREPARYFAAIVFNQCDAYKAARGRERRSKETLARFSKDHARAQQERAATERNPVAGLRRGLELVAQQWMPMSDSLLGGGAGLGALRIKEAWASLVSQFGPVSAQDVARSVLRDFASNHQQHLGDRGVRAVSAVLERISGLAPTRSSPGAFAPPTPPDRLRSSGKNWHPEPPSNLSI